MFELLLVVWLHFFADFILQTDTVAKGKSKSNLILLKHVGLYAIPFLVIGVYYAIVNAILHFMVDWVTSRWTSHLYQKGDRHNFFVTIGLDQAIHITCLIWSLQWFGYLSVG